MNSAAVQRISETAGKAVQAGLCRTVDVICAAHPDTGHGREDNDLAATLSFHQFREKSQDADLRHVIGVNDSNGMSRIGFRAGLITQDSERQHRDVDPAVCLGNLCEEVCMGVGCIGIEFDSRHG